MSESLAHLKWRTKNKKIHNKRNREWYRQNSEKHKQANLIWNKTKKGKQYWKKILAKRRQRLNWILMFPNPFNDSVLVDYHHITDAYVVAIPRDLHRLHLRKYHRENTMEIVKQIYLED